MAEQKKCVLCGSTGRLWLFKSWFTRDGFRHERCGICAGTGQSDYRPGPDYIKEQRDIREKARGIEEPT